MNENPIEVIELKDLVVPVTKSKVVDFTETCAKLKVSNINELINKIDEVEQAQKDIDSIKSIFKDTMFNSRDTKELDKTCTIAINHKSLCLNKDKVTVKVLDAYNELSDGDKAKYNSPNSTTSVNNATLLADLLEQLQEQNPDVYKAYIEKHTETTYELDYDKLIADNLAVEVRTPGAFSIKATTKAKMKELGITVD